MPGKEFVSKLPIFARDDENDTHLFERWQEIVMEQCPNPDRIGCFDRETLRTFVETPEKLDLEDPKYIHVTECAESTRELRELRSLREERLRQTSLPKTERRFPSWQLITGIAACAVALIILSVQSWRNHTGTSGQHARVDTAVSAIVDLSADGLPRGAGQDARTPDISLPRRVINLRLILPYYSPLGAYRVTVGRDRNENGIKTEASGSAIAEGSRTEVRVNLDLRQVVPGRYYLGTARVGDGAPYYYPFTVNE